MHDLVIAGGVAHDGLGSPGAQADVATDAEGRFVAPGFVDAHSHSDARGTPQPGSIADLCVFDPKAIEHPGNYAYPSMTPVGIHHVLLAGSVVVEHGEFTGARKGRDPRA